MELLETISYDNADYASKGAYARDAAGIWEDEGYAVEIRNVPDIVNENTAAAYQDGGRFELWGTLQ